ncbi:MULTISPECIES: YhgE/Pip domain-containing protein [Bacillus]|uniref:YhgE/Pip domain-containing protein n=1 Tax=Bacillus TaxID=1386 RepID=UPI000369DE6C|nr:MULTISPECIES: YhgE/Pip domain-containing protein [Bacillus]
MKKVLDIFFLDWRRISQSKAALFLVISLMILPSLYAWFNIKALWDPYGNTSGIKIAVANDDIGMKISGESLNVGDKIVEKLKNNHNLGWTFVSKKEADRGVTYGDYYASLYIPKDFSEHLGSLLSDNPERAEIIFTINDKINAITPKITATGANTVTNQVSDEFVDTVSSTLLEEFNKVGIELDKDLPTIRRLEAKLYQIRDALPQINDFGEHAKQLEAHLPQIKEKANKIISITDYIPKVNEMGQSVLKINKAMPKIEQAGKQVLVLQSKIPEIRNMAQKVNEINEHFDVVQTTLDEGLKQANKALDIVQSTQALLPKIQEVTNNSQGYVDAANQFLNGVDSAFDQIASVVKLNIGFANQLASSVAAITDQMINSNISPQQLLLLLQQANVLLQQENAQLTQQISHIQSLINNGVAPTQLQTMLNKLQSLQNRVQSQQRIVQNAIATINNNPNAIPNTIQEINNEAIKIREATSSLLNNYDSTYLPAIRSSLTRLKKDLQSTNEIVLAAKEQLPNVANLLGSTEETLQNAANTLRKFQAELPNIKNAIEKATNFINQNLNVVIDDLNKAALFYQQRFPDLRDKLDHASQFIQSDLPKLEEKITTTAALVQEKMPQLVDAISMAGNLSRSELPNLSEAVTKATNKIDELKKKTSLEKVINILRRDVQADSDFMAKPVELKEIRQFPIANYGSASSPFYTALAIWVGSLLLVSLLSVDVHMPKAIYKPHHFYFGRGLTFLLIALIQTAIVSIGDIFLLGIDAHMKGTFILFSLLISFAFVTIVYTLVAIFGNLGKGMAIILLVLQISSSGGNFPIEVSSTFFQRIYPFLPFTYAVKLLREALGGVVWKNAIVSIIVLLFVATIFIIIGTILKKPLMNVVNKFTENAKKSRIFH